MILLLTSLLIYKFFFQNKKSQNKIGKINVKATFDALTFEDENVDVETIIEQLLSSNINDINEINLSEWGLSPAILKKLQAVCNRKLVEVKSEITTEQKNLENLQKDIEDIKALIKNLNETKDKNYTQFLNDNRNKLAPILNALLTNNLIDITNYSCLTNLFNDSPTGKDTCTLDVKNKQFEDFYQLLLSTLDSYLRTLVSSTEETVKQCLFNLYNENQRLEALKIQLTELNYEKDTLENEQQLLNSNYTTTTDLYPSIIDYLDTINILLTQNKNQRNASWY